MPAEDSTKVPLGELSPNDQKMMASAQFDDVDDAEKPEFKLTPEIENQIMARIKDISSSAQPWTRVTNIQRAKKTLPPLLNEGILGNDMTHLDEQKAFSRDHTSKEKWREFTRKYRNTVVHFNINRTGNEIRNPLGRMTWGGAIALTFNLDNFTDFSQEYADSNPEIHGGMRPGDSEAWKKIQGIPGKTGTYRSNDLGDLKRKSMHMRPGNESYPSPEFGYILHHRIAPRELDGIIIEEDIDLKDFIQILLPIYATSPKSGPLPVYNVSGDLLWPQQMTHDEVVKFIEERDKEEEKEAIKDQL